MIKSDATCTSTYIGIDVSAHFFHATIIDSNRKVLDQFEKIDSDESSLRDWSKLISGKYSDNTEIHICMEHTGVYSLKLAKFFHESGFAIYMVAPQLLKKINSIRKAKTDTLDSHALADYLSRYDDKLKRWQPKSDELQKLERLLSAREFFVKSKVALKNRISAEKHHDSKSFVITTFKKELQNLEGSIKDLEKEINDAVKKTSELMYFKNLAKSVPGVGDLLACEIMVTTELLETCNSPKQLRSYLGIAPIIQQSGISLRPKATSTGHGPNRIRRLLHLAARTVVAHYPEFREYYLRKVDEGKAKMLVLNNIENKLINIIWAVIQKNRAYIPGYRSIDPKIIFDTP